MPMVSTSAILGRNHWPLQAASPSGVNSLLFFSDGDSPAAPATAPASRLRARKGDGCKHRADS
ncbi:hypothetical protein L484_007096 [Morus notabilis]|uniref:Uncharacterized protein n=1 Tax=Morus notabilis TaxID=981085 RepID=W9S2E3_9ROSA|nr:hypothetical protein L484_007096 [Morus notabilis]